MPGTTTSEDRTYTWGNEVCPRVANVFGVIEPDRGRPAALRSFPDRSPIGALDTGENRGEWVADCYTRDFTRASEPCAPPVQTIQCKEMRSQW